MEAYFLLIIFAVILISWLLYRKERKHLQTILEKQAAKLNGRVRAATLFTYPQLYFPYHGVEILVSAMPGSSGQGGYRSATSFAQLYFETYPDHHLEIRNKSVQTMVDKVLGQKDFETGNPKFDNQFFVRCSSKGFIRSLLTREVQDRLLEFEAGDGLYISLTRTTLYKEGRLVNGVKRPRLDVSISRISTQSEDYERLIRTATLLYDRLRNA